MLTELCGSLHNWFVKSDDDKLIDTYIISGGVIAPSVDLQNGQYYRIIGSLFNDGVHKYGDDTDKLTDETFEGAIWKMYVPPEVISLSSSIDTWKTANAKAETSPYQSESFGGYSYSRKTGANGASFTWEDAFATQIARWRKL